MTVLTKPVKRIDPRNALVITLTREGLLVREKGRRTTYGPIPFTRLYQLGAQMKADSDRREKAHAKALKRVLRRG